jgi:hypothetical protein
MPRFDSPVVGVRLFASVSYPCLGRKTRLDCSGASGHAIKHPASIEEDTPMNLAGGFPIVRIQFGNLDTFCDELTVRGPNIEPRPHLPAGVVSPR